MGDGGREGGNENGEGGYEGKEIGRVNETGNGGRGLRWSELWSG